MPSTATLLVFATATLALLAIPGPSVIFVVARTLEHGRAAGLVSVLGIETGALVHVAAAATGISALIAASPVAVTALRWGGGLYLVALGVRALAARRGGGGGEQAPTLAATSRCSTTRRRLFAQGVLVDLLNVKTALFFIAFLPQFVEPGHGPVALQTAVLGLTFVALALLSDGAYALVAARLGGRRAGGAGRGMTLASGGAYVGLGTLALAGGA
jgi:threonine/homoserine/homoserine lactone efflux protein